MYKELKNLAIAVISLIVGIALLLAAVFEYQKDHQLSFYISSIGFSIFGIGLLFVHFKKKNK